MRSALLLAVVWCLMDWYCWATAATPHLSSDVASTDGLAEAAASTDPNPASSPDDEAAGSFVSLSFVPISFPALGLGGMLELFLCRYETLQISTFRLGGGWDYGGVDSSLWFAGILGVGMKRALMGDSGLEVGFLAFPLGGIVQSVSGDFSRWGGLILGLVPVDLHLRQFFGRWFIQGGLMFPLWWTYGNDYGYDWFPPALLYMGGGL